MEVIHLPHRISVIFFFYKFDFGGGIFHISSRAVKLVIFSVIYDNMYLIFFF